MINRMTHINPNQAFKAREEKIIRAREGLFPPSNPLVTQFLQHVIYGEQREAEEILVKHHKHQQLTRLLLTEKAKVKDYAGREIYGTALQMALGAGDVRYHKDEECMFEMLRKWMKLLPDGEALMAAQITEQFPEDYEEQERKRIKEDHAALIKVLDAIRSSDDDAECERALQEFDHYLKPKGVIRTGKHFNEKLLEMAFEICSERYGEFDENFQSRKNNLAWCRVIGRIQRNCTACLAQVTSQGYRYILFEGEKLQRTLKLRNYYGAYFYPDVNPEYRLGVNYAIAGPCVTATEWGWGITSEPSAEMLAKLYREKNTIVATTYAAARETIRQMRGNVAMF